MLKKLLNLIDAQLAEKSRMRKGLAASVEYQVLLDLNVWFLRSPRMTKY